MTPNRPQPQRGHEDIKTGEGGGKGRGSQAEGERDYRPSTALEKQQPNGPADKAEGEAR